MPFANLASTSFASTTGFSAEQMYGWSTTTIDTFSAVVLGTVAVSYPYILAAAMLAAIVCFAFVIIKVFF